MSPSTVPRWYTATSKFICRSLLLRSESCEEATLANNAWSSPDVAFHVIRIGFDADEGAMSLKETDVTRVSREEGDA